jgi:NADH dehydrogenase FAD-containing subunit
VDKFLRVRGAAGIYALGDCADVKEGTQVILNFKS